jgi:hypothetical protein
MIGISVVVAVWILHITSYRNFFFDEWAFIESRRPWQLDLILLPHNEHWSTLPILLWKILFIAVGLRSHVPYEAAALVAHVAAVLLLFALIRRRSGDVPAFGAALMLLVLGSGADDIVWAFQVAWAGSVAFGLAAMLMLDGDPPFPSRLVPVSAALLCSLMCSSVGLAFLVAVGAELLADRRRRRFLLALVIPSAAFVVWFLALDTGRVPGSGGVSGDFLHGGAGWGYVINMVRFVANGLAASATGVVGWGGIAGVALLLVLAVLGVPWDKRGRVESWQIGMVTGIVFFFTLVATGRVQFGIALATQTRYVYVGVVFILPLVADALRGIPWRGLWRPALLAVFTVCLAGNVLQLYAQAVGLTDFMRSENAELQTVEVFRGAPDMALTRYIDDTVISRMDAYTYLSAISELGSPVPPATTATLRHVPPYAVDRVMVNLFGDALTFKSDSSRSTQGLTCRNFDSNAGFTMDFQVPNGQSVMLVSSKGGDAVLFLGLESSPSSDPVHQVQMSAGTPGWVHLPDTGKPVIWKLRIETGAVGLLRVCSPA